jgi:hypothetical protein
VPTPSWLAATSGQATKAGQVNQFLGAHACTLCYSGVLKASQFTAGSGAVNSNSLYIAQSFTTAVGQTTIGRIAITLARTGTPAPFTLSLQASSSGHPSGTPLVSTVVPPDLFNGPAATPSLPLPITGLTASTQYWLVINAIGDPSDYFSWSKSNQVSGASTSANGTTWTAQSYGLMYNVFDATATGQLQNTWEDNGARWTIFAYTAQNLPNTLIEYTAGQTATGYMYSSRGLTYTNGLLTSVS